MSEWNTRGEEEAGRKPKKQGPPSLQPQGGQGGSPSMGRPTGGGQAQRPSPSCLCGQAAQRDSGEKRGLGQAAAPITGHGDPGHLAGAPGAPRNTAAHIKLRL